MEISYFDTKHQANKLKRDLSFSQQKVDQAPTPEFSYCIAALLIVKKAGSYTGETPYQQECWRTFKASVEHKKALNK